MFSGNFLRLSVVFVSCILAVTIVAAQGKLTVIPSKTIVQPNELFQVQFICEGAMAADEFIPPSFKNFEKAGEVVETNGWTWVNGSLTEYISYTYVLSSRIKGKLSIASAVMKLKGKALTSQPIVIQVTDAVPLNSNINASLEEEKPDYYLAPGENAIEKIKKNLFVKAFVDKETCYVGEAVLATFKLYTRLESESKIVKRPSFNGFSVIDLEEPEAGLFTKEMLNGRMYNCYLIRKVQLFPLQSGDLSIEPVEINNLVHLIKLDPKDKNGKNWVDALVDKMKNNELTADNILKEQVITQTPELKIKVLELPAGQPDNFNGAVGTFSLSAEFATKEFAANENGTLRIAIAGSGNINVLNAPVVNWPIGVEPFENKTTEEINKQVTPVTGRKIFEIPFNAIAGSYKVPPVEFSFFDVNSKTYKTLKTDSLEFTVKQAIVTKQNNTSIAPVQTRKPKAPFYIIGGISIVLLLLIAIFVLFLKSKRHTKVYSEPEMDKPSVKPAAVYLETALYVKDSIHPKQFYTLLLDGLQEFLIDRLQMNLHKTNSSAITAALKQRSWFQEAAQWNQIVSKCEGVLFSPVEVTASKDELLFAANELMEKIEKRMS